MKIVYTCITGDKDFLKEQPTHPEWHYVCYTNSNIKSEPWEVRPLVKELSTPRKTARWHKLHPDLLFPMAEKTLWVDASIKMHHDPQWYDEKYGSELSVLPGIRNCLFEEANACIRWKFDNPQVITNQITRYNDEGMPRNYGMIGTGFMFRARNKKMSEFNQSWWKEINNNSIRDQISFPYVCWKLGIRWKIVPLETIRIYRHCHRGGNDEKTNSNS
jgi:hypothetical protein